MIFIENSTESVIRNAIQLQKERSANTIENQYKTSWILALAKAHFL